MALALHHLLNLLLLSAELAPARIGSNWGGVWFSVVNFLLIELLVWKLGDMSGRWAQNVLIGLGGVVVAWFGLFLVSVVLTTYDDHKNQSGAAVRIRRDGDRFQKELREASVIQLSNLRDTLSDTKTRCAVQDGINLTLQKQNRDQQSLIAGCQTDAIKRLIPEPFTMNVTFLEDIPTREGKLLYSRRWLVITNKTITPMSMEVVCTLRPESLSANLAGIVSAVQVTKINPFDYRLDISSSAWSPSSPLVATVDYKDGRPFDSMTCRFIPNR